MSRSRKRTRPGFPTVPLPTGDVSAFDRAELAGVVYSPEPGLTPESRIMRVPAEAFILSASAEDRTLLVAAASRIMTAAMEPRALAVPAEIRTIVGSN